MYHTAVKSLQAFCMQRADTLRRASVDPTERLVQQFNQMLKKQEKEVATAASEGQLLVEEM